MLTIEEVKEFTKDLYIGTRPMIQPTTFNKIYAPIEQLQLLKVKSPKMSYFIGNLTYNQNEDTYGNTLQNVMTWSAGLYPIYTLVKVQSLVNTDLYTVYWNPVATSQNPTSFGQTDWISMGTYIQGEPLKIGYLKLISNNINFWSSTVNYIQSYLLTNDYSDLVIFETVDYSRFDTPTQNISGVVVAKPHMNVIFNGYQVIL